MKLAAGPLKVILINEPALKENERRARASGRIFVPPFIVYVTGSERVPVGAFGWRGNVQPRYALTQFPFEWAPTSIKHHRVWFETKGELTLQTTFPEEANG
jgi:hypothetical protein